MPSSHDPWDQDIQPVAPEQLPPGFCFPPGQEPKPPASGLSSGVKWALVAIAVLVAVAVAIGVTLFFHRGSGGNDASGIHSPASTHSFVDISGA